MLSYFINFWGDLVEGFVLFYPLQYDLPTIPQQFQIYDLFLN